MNKKITMHIEIIISDQDNKEPVKNENTICGKDIYKILCKSFNKKSIQWTKEIEWSGPIVVQLSEIDFSNIKKWAASKIGKENQEKVKKNADKMNEQGMVKPIILLKSTDKLMQVLDGRHRLLSAKKANLPILAYIGHTNSIDDVPWQEMKHKDID